MVKPGLAVDFAIDVTVMGVHGAFSLPERFNFSGKNQNRQSPHPAKNQHGKGQPRSAQSINNTMVILCQSSAGFNAAVLAVNFGINYPGNSAASGSGSDASASATPWLQSAGCVRASRKTAGPLLP